MSLSPLQLRIISAVIMLLVVAVVLWMGEFAFKLLVTILFVAMIAEWLRLLSEKDAWPTNPGFGLSLIVSFFGFGFASTLQTIPMLMLNLGLAALLVLINWKQIKRKWMLVWPIYIALACSCTIFTFLSFGPLTLLWVFMIIWATDTGAFFSGRSIGGPKLMPKVSPKKTWSGAIGGASTALIVSLLFVWYFGLPVALVENTGLLLCVTLLISVVSQAGDLFESFAKRKHSIKDSSQLIPGHGGFLDRLDSALTAIPIAYLSLVTLA